MAVTQTYTPEKILRKTLAAMKNGLEEYTPSSVHNSVIETDWINMVFDELASSIVADISRKIPFSPKRADILPTGTAIFLKLLLTANARRITVSDRGARWGMLFSQESLPPYMTL